MSRALPKPHQMCPFYIHGGQISAGKWGAGSPVLSVEEVHLQGDIIPNITNHTTFCARCLALRWTAPLQWPAPPGPTWWTPAAPSSSQVSVIPQPSNLCPPWMRESARGGAGQRRIASSTHPCPTPAFSTPLALLRETLARDAGLDPRGHR